MCKELIVYQDCTLYINCECVHVCMPRVGSRQASLNLFDLHYCYFLCGGDKIMPVCLYCSTGESLGPEWK